MNSIEGVTSRQCLAVGSEDECGRTVNGVTTDCCYGTDLCNDNSFNNNDGIECIDECEGNVKF